MRRPPPLVALYQVYKLLIFYPLLAASTAVCGTLAAVVSMLAGGRAGTVFGVIWARFNSLITPMRVTVIGREKINPSRSYVVVINHQSVFDIFVLYGWLPVDFRWVMKAELRRVPFLGWACGKVGHVFVDRSRPELAKAQIAAARERIRGGTSIAFFPEGTRSPDGRLLPFKKGAFHFALDLRLPVLPVTISGTRDIVPPHTTTLYPGTARLIVHDPIELDAIGDGGLEALLERTREAIEAGLGDAG